MTDLNGEALLKEAEENFKKTGQLYESGDYQTSYELAKKNRLIFLQFERWEKYVELQNLISAYYISNEGGVNFEEIEKHLIETLEIASQELDEKSIALELAYGYLGYWYGQIIRNPIKAKPIFETSLRITINKYGQVNANTITAYNNMAYLHAINDNMLTALRYMEKAIFLLEELNKTDKKKPEITLYLISYVNLGRFCFKTQQYEKGFFYLKTALQKCETQDFHEKNNILSYIYMSFSVYFSYNKKYTQALFYAEQSLEVRKKYYSIENTEIALSYFEIGNIYFLLKNQQKALFFFQKSLDIRTQFFKSPDREIAILLLHLGKCMYSQKKFDKAIFYCQKSFTYLFPDFQNKTIFDTPEVTKVINNAACLKTMQLKAACLFESYCIDKKSFVKLSASLKTLKQSIHFLDLIKKGYQTTQSILGFLGGTTISEIFNTAMEVTLLMNKEKEAFSFCEKTKANLLLTSMIDTFSKVNEIPSHFLEREKDLKSKLIFLEKQIAKEEVRGEEQREGVLLEWKSQFFDLHQKYLQLIQQFEQDYPDYYQLKYETKTVSIQEIQQSLEENQMMINYFVNEKFLYIFFVSSNDFEVHQIEISNDFEKLVNDFLQSIQQHQFEAYTETAYALYQYLLQPLEMHLIDFFAESSTIAKNEAAKKLLIVPHGILSYVPFEALLCSSLEDSIGVKGELREGENYYHHLDYLLLHCEVSYHYSATLWHYLLKQRGKRAAIEVENSFVGFAPIYESEEGGKKSEAGGDTSIKNLNEAAKIVGQWATRSEALQLDDSWNPLPHSKTEAQNIATLFDEKGLKNQTYLHKEATKEQFQKVVGSSRFLLVAAHGVVNDEQPKLSGLVFYPNIVDRNSISNNELPKTNVQSQKTNHQSFTINHENDCILSMEETYHLNLSKTDLVVLSSCESGIGQLAKGEGMMAVNRGFLYAGAKNVVSTLFKVYDKPSSLLTQYLFEGILKGMDYRTALREAKLRLLQIEEVDVKSWCGFVLIGE